MRDNINMFIALLGVLVMFPLATGSISPWWALLTLLGLYSCVDYWICRLENG